MLLLTLQQLHYMDEIVKQGSINQAALSLFVSQSSISNGIRELEEELGITIFIRHNMGMRLTPEGQKLHHQIQPLLNCEKNILTQYESRSPRPASLTISSLHFPFVTEAFVRLVSSKKESSYKFRLKEQNMQYLIDDVDLGDSEIGVLSVSDTNKNYILRVLSERNLSFHLLREMLPHAILSQNHPLANKTSLHLQDLEGYPYIAFNLEHSSPNYAEEVIMKDFKFPKQVVRLTDRTSVYRMMHKITGYSIGSGILSADCCSQSLVSIPIIQPKDSMRIGYIKPFHKTLSPLANEFLTLLQEEL